MKVKIKPFCCPTCKGQCFINRPNDVSGEVPVWLVRVGDSEKYECPTCEGFGVIWPPQLVKLYSVCNAHDHTVIAVFDRVDLAELFVESFAGGDNNFSEVEIQPFTLNELIEEAAEGYRCYRVEMFRNGHVAGCREVTLPEKIQQTHGFNGSALYVQVLALSEEHAKKLADDVRLDLIAKNKWLTGIPVGGAARVLSFEDKRLTGTVA